MPRSVYMCTNCMHDLLLGVLQDMTFTILQKACLTWNFFCENQNICLLQGYLLLTSSSFVFIHLIFSHSVHWGSKPPSKTPTLNLQTVQALLFRHFPPIYCFFLTVPNNRIFQWILIILNFVIFNPIPSFKSN